VFNIMPSFQSTSNNKFNLTHVKLFYVRIHTKATLSNDIYGKSVLLNSKLK